MQTIDSRSPIQHFIIRKTAASTIQIHCQSKLLEWQGVYDKRMQTLQNRLLPVHENIEAQKPHTKSLKRRQIFPSPSAQRLTKPLMISLRSRAREVVERRACASTPPVCSSVLSACVSRLPLAVSVRPRAQGRIGVPAFSSSSSLNHVSSTTHFSSVSKRMETFQEDETTDDVLL
jgi:hypothetical protein